jgi:hypothetical protein
MMDEKETISKVRGQIFSFYKPAMGEIEGILFLGFLCM